MAEKFERLKRARLRALRKHVHGEFDTRYYSPAFRAAFETIRTVTDHW